MRSRPQAWESRTGRELRTIGGPEGVYVSHVAIHPDGRRLAGSVGERIHVYDFQSGAQELLLNQGESSVVAMAYSPGPAVGRL